MKYLVDTSVWIAHLRAPQKDLVQLLKERRVLIHSCIIGELACGFLPNRAQHLDDLGRLPRVDEASFQECLIFLEKHRLFGKGLGWVDIQLLTSSALSDAKVLSFDKALAKYAESSM